VGIGVGSGVGIGVGSGVGIGVGGGVGIGVGGGVGMGVGAGSWRLNSVRPSDSHVCDGWTPVTSNFGGLLEDIGSMVPTNVASKPTNWFPSPVQVEHEPTLLASVNSMSLPLLSILNARV